MKHTHTIHTNLHTVCIDGNYITDEGLDTDIALAEHFTQERAEDIKDEWRLNMPKADVVIAPVTEEITTTDLYEAVADTLNNANGWDYQHCGRSRYEDATEMVNNLENHDFTAKEVSKFVKDFMAETETPPTIKDIAIGVADRVGAMITLNRYEDLTFHVNIK
jgi:hypothetical protein